MTDLLHRIRWTNLARAFALLLAALLTFSLLRGKHHEPPLPPALTESPAVVAEGGESGTAEGGEAGREGAAGSGGERGTAGDGSASAGAANAAADRADARRRAATRKAARRRAARKATAERARKRRRTAARQRDAGQVPTRTGGTAQPRAWPAAPPAPTGAEFRP